MDAGQFRTLMAGVPAPVTVVTTAEGGLPRLHGIPGFLHGVIESGIPAGGHALLFCRVLGCDLPAGPPPITAARRFGTHSGLLAADPIGAAAR